MTTRALNQTERALWREVFVTTHAAYVARRGTGRSPAKTVDLAALHAQLAVKTYRETILWRDNP